MLEGILGEHEIVATGRLEVGGVTDLEPPHIDRPVHPPGSHRRIELPSLAPIKAGIFPLVKKDGMPELATRIYEDVRRRVPVFYDDGGSIGRRYRRQDEVGTPLCVTVDFDSLEDLAVTVRDRDTMEQARIPIDHLVADVHKRLARDGLTK